MKNLQRLNTRICGSLALVILLIAISNFSLSKASAVGRPTPVVTSKSVPTSTARAESKQDSAPTMMQTIGSIINSNAVIAFVTLLAVIAAFYGIYVSQKQAEKDRAFNQQQAQDDREANQKQAQEDRAFSQQQAAEAWKQSQKQAQEDRQHQSRPIIVPAKQIASCVLRSFNPDEAIQFFSKDNNIQWNTDFGGKIGLHNMGGGPAFNIHAVLHGVETIYEKQFVSWDNGPIEDKGDSSIICDHPRTKELVLNCNDSVDGVNPLYVYDQSDPKVARLTITYHDLWGNKYITVSDYTYKHHWIHIITQRIPSLNGNPPLDLKEKNAQKKQQAPKLSAPPVQTSP